MNLYEYDNQIITVNTFVEEMSKHIKKGDTLCLEVDVMRFGKIFPGLSKDEFLEAIFNIFYQLVGEEGNIVIPTFSYSWGGDSQKKHFDILNTSGKVGIFPEYFMKRNNVARTFDPMFSLAVWGKDKEWLSSIGDSSFGKESLYEKAHKLNAKLISFGLKLYDPTFVHYVEQYFHEKVKELDYRFVKKFEGTIVNHEGKEYDSHHFCFSRYLDRNTNLVFDESKLVNDLSRHGKLAIIKIGNAEICISDSNSVFDTGMEGMKKTMHYFMKERGVKRCMDII